MSNNLLRAAASKAKAQELNKRKYADNLSLEDAKEFGTYTILNITQLVEDPLNREYYGDYETDLLANAMKSYGFKGIIYAYPYEGKYRIESGHRTLDAAKKVPMTRVPVIVTEPPKTESERIRRLIYANLHRRKETPIIIANEAQALYESYDSDKQQALANGEPWGIELLALVANDLEISISQVTKYRQLLRLIPELQQLTDQGNYSWSALAAASQLDADTQKMLYFKIINTQKIKGDSYITRQWIEEQIKEFKKYKLNGNSSYQFDPNDLSLYSPELREELLSGKEIEPAKKRTRRVDSALWVKKSETALHTAFNNDAFLKDKKKPDVIQSLKEMRELIDSMLSKLESANIK